MLVPVSLAEPNVHIIVLNWQRAADTIRCLASLDRLTYPAARITVVDNASGDGSAAAIRRARPATHLIETPRNLGFAGGNNAGIRHALAAGADYVWVLNNDTEVTPAALAEVVAVARADPGIGMTGSLTVTSAQPWQDSRPYPTAGALRGREEVPFLCDGGPHAAHAVDYIKSTMLLSTPMLRQIGLIDERFFHYFEEIDLCLRARAAGWRIALVCQSRIWHRIGSSLAPQSPQALYYSTRNHQLLRRKHWRDRPGETFLREPRFAGWVLSTATRALLRGRWARGQAVLLGVADGLRGRTGPRSLRYDQPAPHR